MSLFFFHLSESGEMTPDPEGRDCAGLEEAQRHAIVSARGLMGDEVMNGRLNLASHIDIEDRAGTALLAVPFGLVVRVSR